MTTSPAPGDDVTLVLWGAGADEATLLDMVQHALVESGVEDDEADSLGGSHLPADARRALTTLLTNRFIIRSRNRSVWDALLAYENEIRERLADMFLLLVVDRDYEVAFKRQDPAEDAPRLLRRDRPLHRDASLLLIHLRKEHTYTDATDDPEWNAEAWRRVTRVLDAPGVTHLRYRVA